MSDKTRAEFEEVFPLPSKCWWSEKSSAYCWAGFSVTRHPHDELWQVWLAAKEKYEPSAQQQEAGPININYRAHAEALAEAAKQAYLLLLKIRSEDRYTLDYQYTLCVLRDQIAEYEGRSAEDAQNDYESCALAAVEIRRDTEGWPKCATSPVL